MSGYINIIVGPPCAGKSSYVLDKAVAGDVVVDYDLIAKALGSKTQHGAEGDIASLSHKAREVVVSSIKDGINAGSWIIHTNPNEAQISEYVEAGAKFVVIDPTESVCKLRAKEANRHESVSGVIGDWYANPPNIPKEHRLTISEVVNQVLQAMG